MTDANAPVSVVFVCWGNICRSPMAERIARAQAQGSLLPLDSTPVATQQAMEL